MGYYLTRRGANDKHDCMILFTQEEYEIANAIFNHECREELRSIYDKLPIERADNAYFRILGYYVENVLRWVNAPRFSARYDHDERPSDIDDLLRVSFYRRILREEVRDYQNGKEPFFECHFYSLSDEQRFNELRRKLEEFVKELEDDEEKHEDDEEKHEDDEEKLEDDEEKHKHDKKKSSEEELFPVGAEVFYVEDFERIIPVVITDRKAFLFYCRPIYRPTYRPEISIGLPDTQDDIPDEDEILIVPCHRLFKTEEAAQEKIRRRNERRDAAINKYHLLEPTDNDELREIRELSLIFLYYDHDLNENLINMLEHEGRLILN